MAGPGPILEDMDTTIMARAIELSREGMHAGDGGPFGAVVVRDGVIIAEATNLVLGTNDPTAHAEVVALRRAAEKLGSFTLAGCELYASCEPCPMCLGAIYWARVKRVFFANTRHDAASIGFDDTPIYEKLSRPVGQRSIDVVHAPDQRARDVFGEWLAKGDRVEY